MRLIFKQRMFSWFDSYDIYDEYGNVVYTVEGKMSWGRKLHINDALGVHIATLKQKVFAFLPTFQMYVRENYVGSISKELTLFKPAFYIYCNGWQIEGDFMEWDYSIADAHGIPVATVAVNGSVNAALLAAQILAVSDAEIAAKLDAKRVTDAEAVLKKDAALQAELNK